METLRTDLRNEFEAEKNEIIASYEKKLGNLNIQDTLDQPIVKNTEENMEEVEMQIDDKKLNLMDKVMVSSSCGYQGIYMFSSTAFH
jgi:hypothetical protein